MKKIALNQMVGLQNFLGMEFLYLVDNFWLNLLYQSIKGSVVHQMWTLEKNLVYPGVTVARRKQKDVWSLFTANLTFWIKSGLFASSGSWDLTLFYSPDGLFMKLYNFLSNLVEPKQVWNIQKLIDLNFYKSFRFQ